MLILRWKYMFMWFWRKVRRKVFKTPIILKRYAGKPVMSIEETERGLFEWIISGRSFMAARLGGTELNALINYEKKGPKSLSFKNKAMHLLVNYSGFFPDDPEQLDKFCAAMHISCKSLDMLGVWNNYMEDYFVSRYCNKCLIAQLQGLEPWYAQKPWTAALKGKRVLVIHPFEKTIQSQYKRREKIFPGTDILPEFRELYTLKAVQTIAGKNDERFHDWFEALDWMLQEALKYDFELAIIGCGAYGFPLAARIKEAGRQAVHMGGATQLLFGIKGKRWDVHPVISGLYNDYWVRPDESERPKGAESVEDGCYW